MASETIPELQQGMIQQLCKLPYEGEEKNAKTLPSFDKVLEDSVLA